MKTSPLDGIVAGPTHNQVLGEATDAVLIDSRFGTSIPLAKALPHATYRGTWFDPTSGNATDAGSILGAASVTQAKPDDKDWLLLPRAS